MTTVGRKKRKRKPGSRTGVTVKPHSRTPRGSNTKSGKRKRAVHVDPYSRGKPRKGVSKSRGSRKRKKKR